MWIAIPSSYRTCTDYSLPVSRRTAKNSGHFHQVRSLSWEKRYVKMAGVAPVKLLDELRERIAVLLQID
jgi:hypothetical protein